MKAIKMKKGMALFLAIFIFASTLFTPLKAEAHDTFFLQVLIDENTKQYQGNIIDDKLSGNEAKHVEQSTALFYFKFWKNGVHKPVSSDPKDESYTEPWWQSTDAELPAPYSFPSTERGEAYGGVKKNDANKNDAERAYMVRDTLMPGLNDALFILNGSKPFKNVDELLDTASKLTAVPRGKIEEPLTINKVKYKVTFGTKKVSGRASYGKPLTTYQKNTLGLTNGDFVRILTPDGEEFEFVYRIPKGYKTMDGYTNKWDNRVYNEDYDQEKDVHYITWHILIFQGNYALFEKGWSMTNADEIVGAGAIEEFFVGLLQSTLNGLRNLLGLYSMNELIYNEGVRGSSAWVHGTMPEAWHDNVVNYHFIFQAFAWTLITLAIIKNLIQRNLATINPGMRVSMIEQIQNLLITGFILSSIFPIIAMFMYLNVKVVDIFGSMAPDFADFSGLNNYSNMLSGMILQVFYFIVTLYLNFVYILRSITLAILIAMAPIFVVTIAFGGQWKQLFGVWMKELISNIFLQSFHAFILAFFVTTTVTSRGIEGMVIAFAMIPLTEFFRSLVMGQAGGVTSKLGLGATSAALGVASKSMGLAKRGGKAVAGKVSGSEKGEGVGSGNTADRNTAGAGQQPGIKSMGQGGSNVESVRAMKDKGMPLDVFTKGTPEEQAMYQAPEMSGTQAGMKDAWETLMPGSGKDMAMGAGKALLDTAGGLAQAGLGMGVLLALGGSDHHMIREGTDMIGDGARKVGGVAKGGVSGGTSRIGDAYSAYKAGRELDKKPQFKTPVANTGMAYGGEKDEYEKTTNGYRVHRDGNQMHEEHGVIRADMNGNNAIYQYDSSRLGDTDRQNLQYYADVFAGDSEETKQYLRDSGIEGVSLRNDGGFMVTYNSEGMKQMGIESVYTVGEGEDKRIVETKSNDSIVGTYNTVNVQPALIGSSSSPIKVSPPNAGQGLRPTQVEKPYNQTIDDQQKPKPKPKPQQPRA